MLPTRNPAFRLVIPKRDQSNKISVNLNAYGIKEAQSVKVKFVGFALVQWNDPASANTKHTIVSLG